MRLGEYLQIGSKMKRARVDSGLSQSDMAKKLNLSNSAYSNYENSYSEPQMEIIENFCSVLKITVPELLELNIPTKNRSPITTYSDVLFVFTELERLGMQIDYDCHKDENTKRLVADFAFHNPQMVAMANGLSEYNNDLKNGTIDEERYQMKIDSLMSMFNVPISENIDKN